MKNKGWTKRKTEHLLAVCVGNSKLVEQIVKRVIEKQFDQIAFDHVNNLEDTEDIEDLNTLIILPDGQKIILIACPYGSYPFFIRFFKYRDPVFNTRDLQKH